MKLIQIDRQFLRDFIGVYLCEHCEKTVLGKGYDDAHFYNVVIPQMECRYCGECDIPRKEGVSDE